MKRIIAVSVLMDPSIILRALSFSEKGKAMLEMSGPIWMINTGLFKWN